MHYVARLGFVVVLLIIAGCSNTPQDISRANSAQLVYHLPDTKTFDGSTFLEIPDSNALDVTSSFTLSAHIKKTASSPRGYVFSKDGVGRDTTGAFNLSVTEGSPGKLRYETNNLGSVSGGSVGLNSWRHIVANYENGTLRLYIDGRQIRSASVPAPRALGSNLLIGRRGSTVGTGYFVGQMRDLRIYDDALSPSEIPANVTGPSDDSGDAPTSAQKVYHLDTIQVFNGSSADYLEIEDSDSLDLGSSFSMSAWVYKTQSGTETVFSKDGLNSDTTGAYNLDISSGGRLYYHTNNRGGLSGGRINSYRWYHVAVSYNSNRSEQLRLFVDGRKVAGGNAPAPSKLTTPLLVGRAGRNGNHFGGIIADARLYKGTLSDTQITELANRNRPGEVYYVSRSGSNSASGTSPGSPLRSLQGAASRARSGDVIFIRGNIYKEYNRRGVWVNSGTRQRPINVSSYPGETAIFDGAGPSPSSGSPSSPELFSIVSRNGYAFSNLVLRNSAGRGINLIGNDHRIRNVRSHDHHGDGLFIRGSRNVVEQSAFHGNYSYKTGGGSSDGLKIDRGDSNVIRRVLSYNNSDDGFDLWASTRTLIEHSVSYENGYGSNGDGIGFKLSSREQSNSRNTARFNIAYRNKFINFSNNNGGGITLYNNTSFDSDRYGIVMRGQSGDSAHTLRNNLSYRDPQNLVNIQSGSVAPNSRYNSWDLSLGGPGFSSTTPPSGAQFQRDFVNSSFLKLSSGSAAIDRGTNVGLDYSGRAPDLGAYERR